MAAKEKVDVARLFADHSGMREPLARVLETRASRDLRHFLPAELVARYSVTAAPQAAGFHANGKHAGRAALHAQPSLVPCENHSEGEERTVNAAPYADDLQAAVDALGGWPGRVWLPPCEDYLVREPPLRVHPGVLLLGGGPSSRIIPPDRRLDVESLVQVEEAWLGSSKAGSRLSQLAADRVIFENLSIDGRGRALRGLRLQGIDVFVSLSSVLIRACVETCLGAKESTAPLFLDTVRLFGSERAVTLDSCATATLVNCTIRDAGVGLRAASTAVRVQGSQVLDCGHQGIVLESVPQATIVGCIFRDNALEPSVEDDEDRAQLAIGTEATERQKAACTGVYIGGSSFRLSAASWVPRAIAVRNASGTLIMANVFTPAELKRGPVRIRSAARFTSVVGNSRQPTLDDIDREALTTTRLSLDTP